MSAFDTFSPYCEILSVSSPNKTERARRVPWREAEQPENKHFEKEEIMSRRDTGLIASFINWITRTGRTVRHTTTFWGCLKVEVMDYNRGYRTVRIRKQGFFGNRN